MVSSGRGAATTTPTYGVAKDATKLVRGLPPALFDKNLKHRPCGLLCKLSAAGMIVCDVLGLPLPPFILAEPIGKAIAKIVDDKEKLTAEVKKAKAAAKRQGTDLQSAEAEVLRRRVNLPLPTRTEIEKPWRQIQKAAKQGALTPLLNATSQHAASHNYRRHTHGRATARACTRAHARAHACSRACSQAH